MTRNYNSELVIKKLRNLAETGLKLELTLEEYYLYLFYCLSLGQNLELYFRGKPIFIENPYEKMSNLSKKKRSKG